jgi:LacI family transcriptional regulator
LFLDDQARAAEEPEWLLASRFDGVIVRHRSRGLAKACAQRGVPCVDLGDEPEQVPGVPQVRPDNPGLGALGARHLLERGYRTLAFVGLSARSWSRSRQEGFVQEAESAGHATEVFASDYGAEVTPEWEREDDARLEAWLGGLRRPWGLMACNDLRAVQVLRACARLGLRVPNEAGVLGANNEVMRCEIADPELSSVSVDYRAWGYTAARVLEGLLQGYAPEHAVTLLKEPRVASRRSTDARLVEDRAVAAALELIYRRPRHDMDLGAIAKSVGLSRRSLERRFQAVLRRPPQDEIRAACLRRVQELLRDTNHSVGEVAEAAGFRSPEYLSVFFKRMTGQTPREYRSRHFPGPGR